VITPIDLMEEWRKDSERYRWLVKRAAAGDWGGFCGWRIVADIPGAESLETLEEAIDAAIKRGE
jgi:hypothetical protein